MRCDDRPYGDLLCLLPPRVPSNSARIFLIMPISSWQEGRGLTSGCLQHCEIEARLRSRIFSKDSDAHIKSIVARLHNNGFEGLGLLSGLQVEELVRIPLSLSEQDAATVLLDDTEWSKSIFSVIERMRPIISPKFLGETLSAFQANGISYLEQLRDRDRESLRRIGVPLCAASWLSTQKLILLPVYKPPESSRTDPTLANEEADLHEEHEESEELDEEILIEAIVNLESERPQSVCSESGAASTESYGTLIQNPCVGSEPVFHLEGFSVEVSTKITNVLQEKKFRIVACLGQKQQTHQFQAMGEGFSWLVKIQTTGLENSPYDSILWREFRILSNVHRDLKPHFPRLASGTFSFYSFIMKNTALNILCTEQLQAGPAAIVTQAMNQVRSTGMVPDEARLLLQEQCEVLVYVRNNGLVHGDVKPEVWQYRSGGDRPTLVLTDPGFGVDKSLTHSNQDCTVTRRPSKNGFLSIQPPRTSLGEAIAVKDLLNGFSATTGFRSLRRAANKEELFALDVYSLAMSWLEIFGKQPGENAENFEKEIYKFISNAEYNKLLGNVPDEHHQSHSVKKMLEICSGFLKPEHMDCWTPSDALASDSMQSPNIDPDLLHQLKTTGVIMQGRNIETGLILKPVLIVFHDVLGFLVYALLNYQAKELAALYGGTVLMNKGKVEFSVHNLSIGSGNVLNGAVSYFSSLNDFFEASCCGSWILSSRVHPDTSCPGNLQTPDRLSNSMIHSTINGTNRKMAAMIMRTNQAVQPSSLFDWDYGWSAGRGRHILSDNKIRMLQAALVVLKTDQPYQNAIQNAREQVLKQGYTDSVNDVLVKEIPLVNQTSLQPEVSAQPEPLPVEVVKAIENSHALSGQLDRNAMLKLQRQAPIFSKEELKSMGVTFLDDFPKNKTEFDLATKEQGIMIINGEKLALEVAETVIQNSSQPSGMRQSFCQQSAKDATSTKQCQRGKTPVSIQGILCCIYLYLVSVKSSFRPIFQRFQSEDGSAGSRSECKIHNLPEPLHDAEKSLILNSQKLAGFLFIRYFFERLFYVLVNIIPDYVLCLTSYIARLNSILLSDRTTRIVDVQDIHTDKQPVKGEETVTVLYNVSEEPSFVGIVINSPRNIRNILEFDHIHFKGSSSSGDLFKRRLMVTHSFKDSARLLIDIMPQSDLEDKVDFAWGIFAGLHICQNQDLFKPMKLGYLKMPPFQIIVMNQKMVHWGAPYPGPAEPSPVAATAASRKRRHGAAESSTLHFR